MNGKIEKALNIYDRMIPLFDGSSWTDERHKIGEGLRKEYIALQLSEEDKDTILSIVRERGKEKLSS